MADMKTELHCHTARYSGCAVASPEEVLSEASRLGYEAVFFTEHDAVWPARALRRLGKRFAEVKVFGGVEVTLIAGEHLLVLGTSDAEFVSLADRPVDLLAKAREDGCLTVLAHPFRWQGAHDLLLNGRRPDALEYLSCNHQGQAAADALACAGELSLPVVNAGDVHDLPMLGNQWIETDRPVERGQDIREIVLGGAYRLVTAEDRRELWQR
jgi:hypothetical protein